MGNRYDCQLTHLLLMGLYVNLFHIPKVLVGGGREITVLLAETIFGAACSALR